MIVSYEHLTKSQQIALMVDADDYDLETWEYMSAQYEFDEDGFWLVESYYLH